MESCGSFCITEKSHWKKAPQTEAPKESVTAGKPHQDYTGASLDREALSLYMFTYTARETGEAGLMYYRARYYQPGIGRFVSEDPLDNPDPDAKFGRSRQPHPQPLFSKSNKYVYVQNIPIRLSDPFGLEGSESGGGGTSDCCKKCPCGYWSGTVYDFWWVLVSGFQITEGDLTCTCNTSLKVHYKNVCVGASWAKKTGWANAGISFSGGSVHCFNAICPQDLSGGSGGGGSGRGYMGIGASVGYSYGGGTHCITLVAGFGAAASLGANDALYQVGGCTVTIEP